MPVPLTYCIGDKNMNAQNTMCRKIFSLLSNILPIFFTYYLLMTNSFYRIHVGCLLRWDVAKEHTDKHADEE